MIERKRKKEQETLCKRVIDEGIILALLEGELPLEEENFWLEHVRECKDCLALASDIIWADASMKSLKIHENGEEVLGLVEFDDTPFALSQLGSYQTLNNDLYNDKGEFLLAKGTNITPAIMEILIKRGVTRVKFKQPETTEQVEPKVEIAKEIEPPAAEPVNKHFFYENLEPETETEYVSRDFREGFFFAGEVSRQPRFKASSYRKLLSNVSHREVIARDTKRRAFVSIEQSFNKLHLNEKVDLLPVKDIAQEVVKAIIADEQKTFSLLDMFLFSSKIYSHSFNTLILFTALAKSMNFDEKDIVDAGECALMHDIGRIIPLREDEQDKDVIRNHSARGYRYLMKQGIYNENMLTIVLNHHERYDGKGFPRSVPGDKLKLLDQLLIVSNRYDQAVTDPIHDVKRDFHRAAQLIYQSPGVLVAPDVVNTFLNVVGIFPPGSYIKLKSGEEGIVKEANYQRPFQPNITILKDAGGHYLTEPIDIDLREMPNNAIERTLDIAPILESESASM